MIRKIILTTFVAIIISVLFGEKATELVTTLLSVAFFGHQRTSTSQERILTKEELKLYNGVDKPELYLSLLGNVFDVSKGAKHYAPSRQYNFFVGRDASRSFVTGEFDLDKVREDVADLSQQDLLGLNNWLKFYKGSYTKIGKMIGKYYDENGKSTPYRDVVIDLIGKAELVKEKEEKDKNKFPPCNIEWNPESGTRVWCTTQSGGVTRSWSGIPRQLYEPGSQSYRCACISEENEKLGNIKEYDGCDHNSESCYIKT